MIDYHQFCQIKDLHRTHGLKAAQIAQTLSLDPKTVAYWLGQERFRTRQSSPRASKLDPFKPQMLEMLEKYLCLPKTLSGLFLRRLWSLLIGLIPSRIAPV